MGTYHAYPLEEFSRMAKGHEIDEALEVSVRWPPGVEPGEDDPARATFGWLRLAVGETALTAHRTDNNQVGDEIQIPLYHIAEWIALNWWALLYEPKKSDDAENDFDCRGRSKFRPLRRHRMQSSSTDGRKAKRL